MWAHGARTADTAVTAVHDVFLLSFRMTNTRHAELAPPAEQRALGAKSKHTTEQRAIVAAAAATAAAAAALQCWQIRH